MLFRYELTLKVKPFLKFYETTTLFVCSYSTFKMRKRNRQFFHRAIYILKFHETLTHLILIRNFGTKFVFFDEFYFMIPNVKTVRYMKFNPICHQIA